MKVFIYYDYRAHIRCGYALGENGKMLGSAPVSNEVDTWAFLTQDSYKRKYKHENRDYEIVKVFQKDIKFAPDGKYIISHPHPEFVAAWLRQF